MTASPAPCFSDADRACMKRALELAARGEGRVEPNPPVGAVLAAADGTVLGEGWHRRFGDPHAEIEAMEAARAARGPQALAGTILYVTLEPCLPVTDGSAKKTPPCTESIIAAGVARVVAGCEDPNPRVSGRGLDRLRRAGLRVEVGLEGAAAGRLVAPFARWARDRRPYVTAKWAMSLDGKVAYGGKAPADERRWISSEASRREVHRLRDKVGAVLVGRGTVEADDPLLTCRIEGGRNPRRVVLDSRARLPAGCRMVGTAAEAPVWVAVTEEADDVRVAALSRLGARIVPCGRGPRVKLDVLLAALAEDGVTHLLVEGGPTVHRSFLEAGLVDRLLVYVSPRMIGEDGVPSPVAGPCSFLGFETRASGPDAVLEAWKA